MIDNIGKMASMLSHAQLKQTLGVLVAKEQLDIKKDIASSQIQLLSPEELDLNLGRNLNVKL